MTANFQAQAEIKKIVAFIKTTFNQQQKTKAVIAVSGGIDSALSLSLLAKALPKEQIFPLFLPYDGQDMQDAQEICSWNKIPQSNWQTINIKPVVEPLAQLLKIADQQAAHKIRLGNIMARSRMIIVFDQAKKLSALVCGTENKSEKILSYFTRYGDEASDLEPIQHLYKTQVRLMAETVGLPAVFLDKQPSAGLWTGQSDEAEFGFSYEQADHLFLKLEQNGLIEPEGLITDWSKAKQLAKEQVEEQVLAWVKARQFKHQVPYKLTN